MCVHACHPPTGLFCNAVHLPEDPEVIPAAHRSSLRRTGGNRYLVICLDAGLGH
ncbi:hypothetical protein F750_0298 [Streptomyces sp. PAMC 26508]|nr:hypothetical protein F750_0298 [Streptomyces sp. PAMC 26508]